MTEVGENKIIKLQPLRWAASDQSARHLKLHKTVKKVDTEKQGRKRKLDQSMKNKMHGVEIEILTMSFANSS